MTSILPGELVLAVDFDGTITTNSVSGGEMVLRENCKEVLLKLHEDGARLVLWTCRAGQSLNEALEFLESEGLGEVFCTVNEQLPEIEEMYTPHVSPKLGADFYIDDRNIMSEEVDWLKIEKYIYG